MPTVRVLLAEDVPADAELELRELKRAGLRVRHHLADTEEAFERALREFVPDIVLSDFSMPGFDGMAALAMARELTPETPFIFVSGTIGEEYAIRAMKNGATDYVLKTNLMRLPAAVERALAEAQERRDRLRTEVELELARERLTTIFNSLPDTLWSLDAKSRRFLYVSPAAKAVFGIEPEALIADPDLQAELIHVDDRPAVAQAWDRIGEQGGFDLDYRIVRQGDLVRWINNRARVVRNSSGAAERIDGLARDITEKIEQRERISYLARYDALTGLPNRTLFHERLSQAVERARGEAQVLALALIDIERFKAINDTLGKQVGDRVLQEVGRRLQDAAGDMQRVARLGPDLFGLLFGQIADAEAVARRIDAGRAHCSPRRSRSMGARCASRPKPASRYSRTTAPTRMRCCATPRPRSSAPRRPASAISSMRRRSTRASRSRSSSSTACARPSSRASCSCTSSRNSTSPRAAW